MDDKPEDWKKLERIKKEQEKAFQDTITEDKANLQYLDPKSFAIRKGFTRDPEAYRAGSEKISSICLATIFFGVILDAILTFTMANLHMGLADAAPAIIESIVYILLVFVPAFVSIFAAIEAVTYSVKTRKKLIVPLINTTITIIVFLVYLKIRELILASGLNI